MRLSFFKTKKKREEKSKVLNSLVDLRSSHDTNTTFIDFLHSKGCLNSLGGLPKRPQVTE